MIQTLVKKLIERVPDAGTGIYQSLEGLQFYGWLTIRQNKNAETGEGRP